MLAGTPRAAQTCGQSPVSGSIAAPRRRSSKCRCGPVELPVEPTVPTDCPLTRHWPGLDRDRVEVRVPAGHAGPVLDHDEPAVAAAVVAGGLHAAAAGGRHAGAGGRPGSRGRCASRRRGAEAVGRRAAERREEAQRRARRRAACGRERGGAGDAVGPSPAQPWKRWSAASPRGAEAAVELAGREAVAWRAGTGARRRPNRARRRGWRGEPSRGRPRQPSAARVRGPATPSTTRPLRAWKRRIARLVSGPRMPSTVAA